MFVEILKFVIWSALWPVVYWSVGKYLGWFTTITPIEYAAMWAMWCMIDLAYLQGQWGTQKKNKLIIKLMNDRISALKEERAYFRSFPS